MLSRQIALVTGASRGIGRGIALQLAEKGATVYATALPPEKEDRMAKSVADRLPTLQHTLEEIQSRGGRGIGMHVDHGNLAEVRRLFERIRVEQDGRLDILVSNSIPTVPMMLRVMNAKFFELPEDVFDKVVCAGLRSHYIHACQAAKVMVPRGRGLIIITNSWVRGVPHMFNGVNKACCDGMAADMAEDLREHNVASVALWPGSERRELITPSGLLLNASVEEYLHGAESTTTEMVGKCVAALAVDEHVMEKTGRMLTDMELATEYGLHEGESKGEKVKGEDSLRGAQPFNWIPPSGI